MASRGHGSEGKGRGAVSQGWGAGQSLLASNMCHRGARSAVTAARPAHTPSHTSFSVFKWDVDNILILSCVCVCFLT